MSDNLDAIFQSLTEALGGGVMNENVKLQIKAQAGSDASVDNVYKAVNKVLGPGVVNDETRKITLKRADAILAGNAKKSKPAELPKDAKADRQHSIGTITDTGEGKDVNAVQKEAFERDGGDRGATGDTGAAGARSQVAAATNSGSNFGGGPGGSINTGNASITGR